MKPKPSPFKRRRGESVDLALGSLAVLGRRTPRRKRAPRPSTQDEETQRTAQELQRETEYQQGLIEALSEGRRRSDRVFHGVPIPYIVHDESGRVLNANRAALALLRLSSPLKPGTSLVAFLRPQSLVAWLNHLRRCILHRSLQQTIVHLFIRAGEIKEVLAITSPGDVKHSRPHGGGAYYTLLLDQEETRRRNDAAVQAQQDYHVLVDLIESVVWEADAENFLVTFVNYYGERLLGYPLTQWGAPGFFQNRIHVDDRDRVLNALHHALKERRDLRIDYRVVSADRKVVWLHDSIRVVERGGRLKLVGVAIDVTEQRKAAEQLRETQTLLEERVAQRTAELRTSVAELEAFSYSLSHDLRAPIRAMQGYASLLLRLFGKQAEPQASDFLRRIMQSAERLDLLIKDVLKYSQVARDKVQLNSVPLEPLLQSILQEYSVLNSNHARIEVVGRLPSVYGHEAFIGQILSNLLTNAVKFVPRDRTPHVRVWAEPARTLNQGREAWTRIWVEDNGVGIAPEDQRRVFHLFERVYPRGQFEGTGVGLAIVQKAAERLGGTVGLESTFGQGSKFWIELKRV